MKKLVLLFLFSLSLLVSQSAPIPFLVKQEIRYCCEDAEEVFLVWGINGWNKPGKELWPYSSYDKGSMVATAMKRRDGFFVTDLNLKPNTMVDYVFWITKGPKKISCDIWDVNYAPQKDYHTLAVNDNVTLINSAVKVRPVHALSILDFSAAVFSVSMILFVGLFLFKKYFQKRRFLNVTPPGIIISGGIVLFIALYFIRASVAGLSWDAYYDPGSTFTKILWRTHYDHLYVLLLVFVFLGLYYATPKFRYSGGIISTVFVISWFISLLSAVLNIRIVEQIGKPFNYRWFYYSGFLQTADSHAALASNLSAGYVFDVLVVCVAFFILVLSFISVLDIYPVNTVVKRAVICSLLILNAGYVLKARSEIIHEKIKYDMVANPVTAFLESVNPFEAAPPLFTMKVPDSLVYRKNVGDVNQGNKMNNIKNIVMIVLESTPAQFVMPYDTLYKVTPVLNSYIPSAVVFDNIYAHAPATNKTMFSLLCSAFPWLSYNSETQEFPGIRLPSLPSVLRENGYRTAFFNSGDNRFQDAGKFLTARGFETIKDNSDFVCKNKFGKKDEKEALDGVDDECTADNLIAWIKEQDKRPFFGMMWTYQTHYPYYAPVEKQASAESGKDLDRYLAAVYHSDAVLGKILNALKREKLFDSTLVVVIGDHGEAFGSHNQTTHASKIYEENVHIPCVFINPFIKPARQKEIGGVSDIAPSITDVLGIKTPPEWQGSALWNKQSSSAYFFCPWSDYLFGFREGGMKYIFNATCNASELYDLSSDPLETINLASDRDINSYQQKLAAWVQYQDKHMNEIIPGRSPGKD